MLINRKKENVIIDKKTYINKSIEMEAKLMTAQQILESDIKLINDGICDITLPADLEFVKQRLETIQNEMASFRESL